MNTNQLYLSKQFSNERTSSAGGGSIAGGDSMVNIVEFEENTSMKSRGPGEKNNSILSTPFKHDEPNESKLTANINFKNKADYCQSVMAQLQSSSKADMLQSVGKPNKVHHSKNRRKEENEIGSLPRVQTMPEPGMGAVSSGIA